MHLNSRCIGLLECSRNMAQTLTPHYLTALMSLSCLQNKISYSPWGHSRPFKFWPSPGYLLLVSISHQPHQTICSSLNILDLSLMKAQPILYLPAHVSPAHLLVSVQNHRLCLGGLPTPICYLPRQNQAHSPLISYYHSFLLLFLNLSWNKVSCVSSCLLLKTKSSLKLG